LHSRFPEQHGKISNLVREFAVPRNGIPGRRETAGRDYSSCGESTRRNP